MEIPKEALKCPYCQHFQNRWTMFIYHPAFAMLVAFIPLAGILITLGKMFDTGEDYVTYKDQIAITESQLVFGETKSSATVDVIGTIKNTSPIAWKEIEFHVDFFDATGKRMDVGEKENSFSTCPQKELLLLRSHSRGSFQRQIM